MASKIRKMRSHEENSCWYRTFHPLAEEFQKEKLLLSHEPVNDFFQSQWQNSERSIYWLLFRWSLAACFCIGVLGSLVQQWNNGIWWIYLTDWGFFLCMFVSLFGAILVTIHHMEFYKFAANSFIVKFYWLSHYTTLVIATLITFMYWLFIYPRDNISPTELYNLWAHGFNSILMLLDHMLVAFPTRILHFIYPLILGFLYVIFSVIYYMAGGINLHGNHYIYDILDWSKPAWATLASFGSLILLLVFNLLLFGLYKLRQTLHGKRRKSKLIIAKA